MTRADDIVTLKTEITRHVAQVYVRIELKGAVRVLTFQGTTDYRIVLQEMDRVIREMANE